MVGEVVMAAGESWVPTVDIDVLHALGVRKGPVTDQSCDMYDRGDVLGGPEHNIRVRNGSCHRHYRLGGLVLCSIATTSFTLK